MTRRDGFRSSTAAKPCETVGAPLRYLFDDSAGVPVFVLNPAKAILAANALAEALFAPFRTLDNLARMAFPDPAARRFFAAWDRFAESIVAGLRHAAGLNADYPASARSSSCSADPAPGRGPSKCSAEQAAPR